MTFLRLSRLHLGLALLAWIGTSAASECACLFKDLGRKGSGVPNANVAPATTDPAQPVPTEKFCAVLDHSGFLAFVESNENSYHVAHSVWTVLKNGEDGNETYFWTSGKFGFFSWSTSTAATTPTFREALFSRESRAVAEKEGRHCLTVHTKEVEVCYYYRWTALYCPAMNCVLGMTVSREVLPRKLVPGSPFKVSVYNTWFEARKECTTLGGKLASVHDQAMHEKRIGKHCTLTIPADERQIDDESLKPFAVKWTEYTGWKNRVHICASITTSSSACMDVGPTSGPRPSPGPATSAQARSALGLGLGPGLGPAQAA
ncbi:hypothetical protein AAVH_25120 [Aphelenchoides avenae]|nr:hypothetical protein AAVH_25120 [Aphelenchus avenae]